MIGHYREFINPICDNCGHMLWSAKSDEEAERAMETEGWEKRNGKDVCDRCLRHEMQHGRLPKTPYAELARRVT